MNKGLIFFVFFLLFNNVSIAHENKSVIQASVSKGFINGLQAKYLKYFAQQLSLDIEISTMPFARRLFELKQGNLDMMVGVQYSNDRAEGLIYIYPSYERLSSSFFSLTETKDAIKNYSDLHNKTIGITRGTKYFHHFDNDPKIQKVETIHLQQSIEMLLHGRIDLLIHNQESVLLKLKNMDIQNRITTTNFQPKQQIKVFLVISEKSELNQLKLQITAIIEKGINNGDFAKIRFDHYNQPEQ